MFHGYGIYQAVSRQENYTSCKRDSFRKHDLVGDINTCDRLALRLEPSMDFREHDLHKCGPFCSRPILGREDPGTESDSNF